MLSTQNLNLGCTRQSRNQESGYKVKQIVSDLIGGMKGSPGLLISSSIKKDFYVALIH